MPKLKTHKGAQKRFKVTAKKKVVHSSSYKSHILTKKTTKRKRGLRQGDLIAKEDMKQVKALLPYSF